MQNDHSKRDQRRRCRTILHVDGAREALPVEPRRNLSRTKPLRNRRHDHPLMMVSIYRRRRRVGRRRRGGRRRQWGRVGATTRRRKRRHPIKLSWERRIKIGTFLAVLSNEIPTKQRALSSSDRRCKTGEMGFRFSGDD